MKHWRCNNDEVGISVDGVDSLKTRYFDVAKSNFHCFDKSMFDELTRIETAAICRCDGLGGRHVARRGLGVRYFVGISSQHIFVHMN